LGSAREYREVRAPRTIAVAWEILFWAWHALMVLWGVYNLVKILPAFLDAAERGLTRRFADILFATTLMDILQVWMAGTVILGFCCLVTRRPARLVVVEAEEARPVEARPAGQAARPAANPSWVRQDQTVEPPGGY
jgi:hypothetical protein